MPNPTQNRTAVVLGVSGQDGAYLASQLLADGWQVVGGHRRGAPTGLWRLSYLDIMDKIELVDIDLSDAYSVTAVLRAFKPERVFHLAGESFVADSFNRPAQTIAANTLGTLNVLNACALESPHARVFFASSSEIFGMHHGTDLLDEDSRTHPNNPYGVSKLAAQQLVGIYRQKHGIFASSGVLFNHESPLRARNFVTRKITFNMARLKLAGGEPMKLGNLESARDWGFAPDFTEAMCRILDAEDPADYVVATGRRTTVRDFLSNLCEIAGFDPLFEGTGAQEICVDRPSGREIATVDARYFRPLDTPPLIGNSARLKTDTGWCAKTDVATIAQTMFEADLRRFETGTTDV